MLEAKPLTAKQQYWLEHLQAADASQMTLTEYAKANGLKARDLYNARWKLKRSGQFPDSSSSAPFVRVQQAPNYSYQSVNIAIRFDNGIQCQVSSDVEALSRVLSQLKSL